MSLALLLRPQLFAFAAGFDVVGASAPGSFAAKRRQGTPATFLFNKDRGKLSCRYDEVMWAVNFGDYGPQRSVAGIGERLATRLKGFVGRAERPSDYRSFLIDMLPRRSTGVEVGVWKGDFSLRLLRNVRPRKIFLIDPWRFEPSPEYERALYGSARAGDQDQMDHVAETVKTRFADEIAKGIVEVLRASSSEAAEQLPDASVDWVYIDGNHLYEYVRADLAAYAEKVKIGGLLTGDDYGDAGWWENGVQKAVDEFLADRHDFVPVIFRNTQFALRRVS